MKATIIVFTGLPGTGKTTLSREVADALGIPLIAKDAIKEIMYDHIGWSDRAFSAKLAHATFGIMEYITEQHLKNGLSIILESSYPPKLASKQFRYWQKEYSCGIIQIVCRTEINILARRYVERNKTDRHPGHIDNNNSVEEHRLDFMKRIADGEDQPLDVKGVVKIIDTTDFSTVSTEEIVTWVKEALQENGIEVFYILDNEILGNRFELVVDLYELSGAAVVTPYDGTKILSYEEVGNRLKKHMTHGKRIVYIEKDASVNYLEKIMKIATESRYIGIFRNLAPTSKNVTVL